MINYSLFLINVVEKTFNKPAFYNRSSNLYKYSTNNPAVTVEQIKLSLNSSLKILYIIFIGISILALILSIVIPKIIGRSEAEKV